MLILKTCIVRATIIFDFFFEILMFATTLRFEKIIVTKKRGVD